MGIISRILIYSRPLEARFSVIAGYTMVTTPRVASYFDARSGSLSDSFYLEDDGPHAVGTAADGDSLLVEVGDVAAEAQGPDVVVDCLPCGGAEALGHPQVLLDARAESRCGDSLPSRAAGPLAGGPACDSGFPSPCERGSAVDGPASSPRAHPINLDVHTERSDLDTKRV